MNVPRVVVAGLYGEGGKTTVATGIMGALTKRGLKVQAFKSGPDHIDATYHTQATKRQSRHLDAWLTSPRTVLESFERSTKNVDVAVVEGAGGIFQGIPRLIDGIADYEGTAQIIRILKAPVILVLDVGSMWMHRAEVIHAVMHVFKLLDKQVNVKGVVLNNLRGWQQEGWVKRAVESAAKVPVIGVIPYNEDVVLPFRRGGLVPLTEKETLKTTLSALIEHVEKHVDIDRVLDIAEQAEALPDIENRVYPTMKREKKVRIGVAADEAFSCYNRDNVDLLTAYGAETVPFSPIHDKTLPPDLDGMYFTGGAPDVFAEQLTQNQAIMKAIKDSAYDGMPIYSEQGGSLYLTESIRDFDGATFPMAGVLQGKAEMDWKMQALDSTVMETVNDNLLTREGTVIHGNDFRFSRIVNVPKDVKYAYRMRIGRGIDGSHEGLMEHNVLAVIGMIYFAFDARIAENFVDYAERYRRR